MKPASSSRPSTESSSPHRAAIISVTYDGRPWLDVGMASINYNVSLGDPTYGWAQGRPRRAGCHHPGTDRPSPSECAVAILACIAMKRKS